MYRFVVLPFGLSSAPYVFTKMMRPLVRHGVVRVLRQLYIWMMESVLCKMKSRPGQLVTGSKIP